MASLVRDSLARTLMHEVQDPRLQNCTITDVAITNDLRQARVRFICHGSSKEVLQGLKKASPFLRRNLGQGLEMKFVPELVFQQDERPEEIHRLMALMGDLQTSP
jgi:ribosome-binding factor A